MEEKQVHKSKALLAVLVGVFGAAIIAGLFGNIVVMMEGSNIIFRADFMYIIDKIKEFAGAFGGGDPRPIIASNIQHVIFGMMFVAAAVTLVVALVKYIVALATIKNEEKSKRLVSTLITFVTGGLMYVMSAIAIFGYVSVDGGSIAGMITLGWGGLTSLGAVLAGFITLMVLAGKEDRKKSVKVPAVFMICLVFLSVILSISLVFNKTASTFNSPYFVWEEAFINFMNSSFATITPFIMSTVAATLMVVGANYFINLLERVFEIGKYSFDKHQEKAEKRFNEKQEQRKKDGKKVSDAKFVKREFKPHIHVLVIAIVAPLLYIAGLVMHMVVLSLQPSILAYIEIGLFVVLMIFSIVYFANVVKARKEEAERKEKAEEEKEEAIAEAEAIEEGVAKEQEFLETQRENDAAKEEEEAPAEEEKPQEEEKPVEEKKEIIPNFDFFGPVKKDTASGAEIQAAVAAGAAASAVEEKEEALAEDEPIMEINGEAIHVEEVEEAPAEEAPVEEEVVEEEIVEEVSETEEESPVEEPVEEAEEEEPEEIKESKPAAKKAPADKKPAAKKSNDPGYRTYHLVKREDGKWEVKFAGGQKAIKLFNTQKEALEYSKKMAENQGGTVLVHNSKGANKGRIQKKK